MPPRARGTIGRPGDGDDARRQGFASCAPRSGAPHAHSQRAFRHRSHGYRRRRPSLDARPHSSSIRLTAVREEPAPGRSHRSGPRTARRARDAERSRLAGPARSRRVERGGRPRRARARRATPRPPGTTRPAPIARPRWPRRRATPGRHALGPAAHRLRRGAGARDVGRSGRAVALAAAITVRRRRSAARHMGRSSPPCATCAARDRSLSAAGS